MVRKNAIESFHRENDREKERKRENECWWGGTGNPGGKSKAIAAGFEHAIEEKLEVE